MEEYAKMVFGVHDHLDKIPSDIPGFNQPVSLDMNRYTWKERNGNGLLSTFLPTFHHVGWPGIIHGGITSGILDHLFAQYCYIKNPGLIPLTKTLEVQFIKPVFPNEVLLARITRSSLSSEKKVAGKMGKQTQVTAQLAVIRHNEAVTVATAEALFVLCEQIPVHSKSSIIPRQMRAVTRLPPELWKSIIAHLPSLTARHATQIFQFGLEMQHEKHSAIWKNIFRDQESWTSTATRQGLNPVLVGADLCRLYENPKQPAYIVLLTGDKTRTIRHYKAKLLSSLRPYFFNETNEVMFRDSQITLNIEEALNNHFYVTAYPEKLFNYEKNRLQSASIYWKDNECALRIIEPDQIVGLAGLTPVQSISHICGITLTPPEEMICRQRLQQCFERLGGPTTRPICPEGYIYNGDNILGWEIDEEVCMQ